MNTRKLTWVAAALLAVSACKKTTPPQAFNSAEEAAAAFIEAAEKFDQPALLAILGSEGKPLVSSRQGEDRNLSVEFAAGLVYRIERNRYDAILSVGAAD
jgi:hypothetical protein